MNLPILNIAAYKFVSLDHLPQRRKELAKQCCSRHLKGTILLSSEGINLFLAGPVDALREWVAELKTDLLLADLEVKESFSQAVPFNRLLVKIKREIIPFGVDGIDPATSTSRKISPAQLKRWLDEGRDLVLFDVRNDFEVEVGTFAGAVPAHIDHFRQFDAALDRLPAQWQEKPVVMFCTGGIRCEKAGPLMERKGFRDVYQLDGGILKYFEVCGGTHWNGDCFVFDDRVAVDPQLAETHRALCYACQKVLSIADQKSPQYVYGRSCPYCYQSPEQQMRARIAQRHAALEEIIHILPGSVPHDQQRPIRIPQRCDGWRLIDVLAEILPQTARQEWEEIIDQRRITAGNVPVRSGRLVRAGEQFLHTVPGFVEPPVSAAIRILWEDESIVVVDKPAPLPVHPSGRFNHNTLLGILNRLYAPQVLRAAHRLDANTTGLLILGRRRTVTRSLQQQFEAQQVVKEYRLRCWGHPAEDSFVIDAPIAERPGEGRVRLIHAEGLPATTELRVLERLSDGTAILAAQPRSGRTNQIRVHLWSIGHPLVGDPLYLPGGALGSNRTLGIDEPPLQLRAVRLELRHPDSAAKIVFEAEHEPAPADAQGDSTSVRE